MAYEMLQDFEASLHRCTQKPVASYLKAFPARPNDLPKLVFDCVYSQDDSPVMTHLNKEKIEQIAHKTVLFADPLPRKLREQRHKKLLLLLLLPQLGKALLQCQALQEAMTLPT